MHLRRMRLIVPLMASAVVLLAASPAGAIKPEFERTKPHVSAHIDLGILTDGTLVAEGGDGTLVLPPDLAPSSQRAWRLSDDPAPMVEGRIVRGQLFIDWVMAYFIPAAAGIQGVPGVVTVMVVPESEPCDSGRGSPATAGITYDGETLTAAVRISCVKPGHVAISNPSWTGLVPS